MEDSRKAMGDAMLAIDVADSALYSARRQVTIKAKKISESHAAVPPGPVCLKVQSV